MIKVFIAPVLIKLVGKHIICSINTNRLAKSSLQVIMMQRDTRVGVRTI